MKVVCGEEGPAATSLPLQAGLPLHYWGGLALY